MFSGVMGYVEATEWIHEVAWFGELSTGIIDIVLLTLWQGSSK